MTGTENITSQMSLLVFQLGFLVIGAFLLGRLFEKMKLPKVLGELSAGILLGPHALGILSFPGFPEGLFPDRMGAIPVSPELYGFAVVASVLLLFNAGLETDLGLFRKYAMRGAFIGVLEVVIDFVLGVGITVLVLGVEPWSPQALILGLILTATSVGVTARNLLENRKMDSPEGVTILSTAVFDDVLGIIVLAIVLGFIANPSTSGHIDFGEIGLIGLKALGIWLGFTLIGLLFSRRLGGFIKLFRSKSAFTLLALGLAFLLAGIFEKAGLAMIIGAYVMGLTLAATDLGIVIQENTTRIREFFIPLFFATMGMMVDPSIFLDPKILVFGLAYTLMAILGKILGSGLPSLLVGFTPLGALRIGLGMIPRGEVALIIAGIGISTGFLPKDLLGVVIMMSLITITLSTTSLRKVFKLPGKGVKKEEKAEELENIIFPLSPVLKAPLVQELLINFESEGFFVHRMDGEFVRYVFRKEDTTLSLLVQKNEMILRCTKDQEGFARTVLYESLIRLHTITHALKRAASPEVLARDLGKSSILPDQYLFDLLDPVLISTTLRGQTKEEVLDELLAMISKSPLVTDSLALRDSVLTREKAMSTGLENGIALPHGRCSGLAQPVLGVGIHKPGVDFDSLDKKPSHIFVVLASPGEENAAHLKTLSSLAAVLQSELLREKLIRSVNPTEVYTYLKQACEKVALEEG